MDARMIPERKIGEDELTWSHYRTWLWPCWDGNVVSYTEEGLFEIGILLCFVNKGIARTQSPTNKNYALESPTFGVIAGVSPTAVQWKGLTLGELPCWSQCPPCQVSMPYMVNHSTFYQHSLQSQWCLVCGHKWLAHTNNVLWLAFSLPWKSLGIYSFFLLYLIFFIELFVILEFSLETIFADTSAIHPYLHKAGKHWSMHHNGISFRTFANVAYFLMFMALIIYHYNVKQLRMILHLHRSTCSQYIFGLICPCGGPGEDK